MRNICDISNLRRWIVVIVCACTAAGCNKSNDHAPLPSETPSSNAPVAAAADSAKQEAVAVSSDTKAKPPRRRKKKKFPRNLSEFGLFEGNIAELKPAESVVQYDVNTPSFADYAVRHRVIRLPEGTSADYRDTATFDLPVGTVIAKTFYYENDMTDAASGRRLVETRILLRRDSGWIGLPYVWDEEQTDATLALAGEMVDVSWVHKDGSNRSNTHVVPNYNDCKRCHKNDEFEPIGLRARHLNRDFEYLHGVNNQLAHWSQLGILSGAPSPDAAPRLPDWDDESTGSVEERARAWLEVNCAHCHNPRGPAQNSGLYLWANVTDPYQYGVYKTPVAAGRGAAGRKYDIVPGKPDESILQHRIESTEAGILMPEFGRTLVHEEGVALIRQWIAEMQPPSDLDVENAIGEFTALSQEQLAEFIGDVNKLGDAARGEEVFHRKRLNCLKCHSVSGIGGNVGPDLGETRPEKTIEYLVESILLPSKEIRKGFETTTVTTADGQVISGIKIQESDSEIVLRDLTRDEIRIAREDIEDAVPGISLMPSNVVALTSRQDFLDLVRFLAQLGKPGPFLQGKDHFIREWEVLDPMPSHAATADPDQLVAGFTSASLIWEPAYSRVHGGLPFSALPPAPNTSRRYVRFRIEAAEPKKVSLGVNSTAGLKMWLDSSPFAIQENNVLELTTGNHTITFMVDLDQQAADTLYCEVSDID